MSHRLTIAASLALPLLAGAVLAQDAPRTVGVGVDGTVVELPVDLAARACGLSAETLLEQWAQLDTQMATMAATSVAADATDLAPVASPEDTQKASGVGPAAAGGPERTEAGGAMAADAEAGSTPEAGSRAAAEAETGTDGTGPGAGADAMVGGSAATDSPAGATASPDTSAAVAGASGDLSPVIAAASPQASAAENPQAALGESAAPTEGTPLSKAAVCQIDAAKAAELGIRTPG